MYVIGGLPHHPAFRLSLNDIVRNVTHRPAAVPGHISSGNMLAILN